MSKRNDFLRELDHLYKRRTRWLRSAVGDKKPGPPPTFKRKNVDQSIKKLQNIASDVFAKKLAKKEFAEYAPSKRMWRVKGHGCERQRKSFDQWFAKWFPQRSGKQQQCVYVFWGKRGKCIYVGRTYGGKNRPRSHFDKRWFSEVKRVDIYPVRLASHLPKLECLAIHRFWPTKNKQRAAKEKWTKECPLCRIHQDIHNELHGIFRFK
jgi:hypothetical protein